MNPPLKWVGGKRWHVPLIKRLYRGQRLVEPFCGGAAVAFGLEVKDARLNDVNPHLINFYKWLQKEQPYELETVRNSATYYDYRTWFNRLIEDRKHLSDDGAMLFFYLNAHGFNNLCRFNRKGEFNVPVRQACPIEVPIDSKAFAIAKSWTFTCGDFEKVRLEPTDFVYADPPYDDGFTSYSAGGFTWDDQERLALLLAGHPGPVVLMNKATDRIMRLYHSLGFHLTLLDSKQKMHQSTGRTGDVLEVMATTATIAPRDTMEP